MCLYSNSGPQFLLWWNRLTPTVSAARVGKIDYGAVAVGFRPYAFLGAPSGRTDGRPLPITKRTPIAPTASLKPLLGCPGVLGI